MQPFTAADAYQMQTNKARKTQDQFDVVLQQCYDRIKYVATLNHNEIIFDVPNYVMGYPPFIQNDLVMYIITRLKTSKFEVEYRCPCFLKIMWPKQDVKSKIKVIPVKKTIDAGEKCRSKTEFRPNTSFVLNLQ